MSDLGPATVARPTRIFHTLSCLWVTDEIIQPELVKKTVDSIAKEW